MNQPAGPDPKPSALSISTTSLPAGQVSKSYSATLSASGGTIPYSWSVSSGTLPAGLTLDAGSGAITGTPSATNSATITFTVADSGNPVQRKTVSLTFNISPAAALAISTTSLPNGQVGAAYSATLAATGGTAPYTWSITSGTLPGWANFDTTTGAISGTPTAAINNLALTFQVKDSETPAQTKTVNLTLTIAPATLAITSTSLPNGQVGTAYSATLSASGGTSPYTWSITSGTLPSWASFNASTGAISGTPTTALSGIVLTFKVTDSSSPAQSQSKQLSLTIAPATLAITTVSLPNGQLNSPYSTSLTAIGGTAPYAWAITSGTLPNGLNFNTSTGAITGTPTVAVTNLALTFKVTDAGSPAQTQSVSLTLTISSAALVITTSALPTGQVGTAYNAVLSAIGGTTPYTWSITSGTLPSWASFNTSTGAITGTPTAAVSNLALTFKVTDSGTPALTQTANLALTIIPALVISTTSLPNGQVGIAYNTTLSASGGTSPYTWSITSGTLPSWASFNTSTGAISGTPTAPVTSLALTFQVKDSETPAQTRTVNLTLTITPATVAITTTSLPTGQVGTTYSATLAATGGMTPFTWSVTSGALPSWASLNASTGAITGTPTAVISNLALTFQVKDSGTPQQIKTANLTLTIAPATLAITTTSLPNGQINVAYNATIAATGGTVPYTWSLTSGALPTNLMLISSTGAITGTPTVSVTNTLLTFQVQDSGSPQQTKSVNLTLTIGAATNITVSISPKRAGLTLGQKLKTLSATVANDGSNQGVNWTITPSGGAFSQNPSLSGAAVTFTAPGTAGVYTITATSVADNTKSASITIGVTDLAGVFTYHNDLSRDGSNPSEYALTPANVNSASFGKLFSCSVDAAVYAQPLWVANLNVGGTRNVVFVATQRDSLYAFDADASPCMVLWQKNLLDAAHGGTSGERPVPSGSGGLIGTKGDIASDIGVTGTPVIDPGTNTLYVVSKSVDSAGSNYFQRLHAIDLISGGEKANSPVLIQATYPGTGDGGTLTTFSAQQENQRPGLALANGTVYIAWASHEDNPPYYGWVISYDATTLAQKNVLNVTPNVRYGGIWMAGGAPAVDSSNNIYLLTGNGVFDATSASPPNNDYGDSFLKISSNLGVLSYFTPTDEGADNANDNDFGSGGAAILVDLPSGTPNHLVIGGGKDGSLYLLNRDALGGFKDSNAWQTFNIGFQIYATSAFWNNTLYIAGATGPMLAFPFNTTTRKFATTASSQSPGKYGLRGTTPSVSSVGNSQGIVWALDNGNFCTAESPGCGPAGLFAYDATNLSNQLWSSTQVGADAAGNAVKFTVPTIANGKVYVGTRGNNTGGASNTTSVAGELDVYGLKPN